MLASDLSSWNMKLMLLENGSKYPIRRTTQLEIDGEVFEKGTKKAGGEFNSAPKFFLKYAEEQWYKFNSTTY